MQGWVLVLWSILNFQSLMFWEENVPVEASEKARVSPNVVVYAQLSKFDGVLGRFHALHCSEMYGVAKWFFHWKLLFWSVFRTQKSKECEEEREDRKSKIEIEAEENYAHQVIMMRSRSVSVSVASDSSTENMRSSSVKSRGLYFPSPIKFFWQSKTSKVIQEWFPLYRG
ncbi:unnamed protein product [Camellia sinensis]